MKRTITYFVLTCLWLLLCLPGLPQTERKIDKVVIDPGHGGKDPGAVGKISYEKNIVLDIALRTGRLITDSYHGEVKVIYTRSTDEFIELYKRAQIANESGADLFISIHCNANPSSLPSGMETFVMGLHKSQDNLEVAKSENAAIFYEEDYKQQYEGFDPNSDEDYIILSLFQSSNLEQSIHLSSRVQDYFRESTGRKDRGVKQAGFWVLYKTTMPGILIEAGFLSNPEEEKYLNSEKGKNTIAESIFNAFSDYKSDFEKVNLSVEPLVKKELPVEVKKDERVVSFRVQFASYKKEKSPEFRKFKGIPDISVYEHDGHYKYTAGNEPTPEAANSLKAGLIDLGYRDAFVVAFVDDVRVEMGEALEILAMQNGKN
ncbi:MAG: N-acetylmuramoyl-L-alanine amidase [Bacteroidales bacterium]|nr:N-acetylmuramoyl-L-alanine amidase [Bacteroidales bacterium]